jgi:phosphatidylglycerol---prolipoprotein diacylglyceryl transferase
VNPPFVDNPLAASVEIGGVYVSVYLVTAHIGFLAGCLVALRQSRVYGVSPTWLARLFPLIYVGAVIGARALSIVADGQWIEYRDHPLLMAQVWRGGFVLYGGLIGGVLAAVGGSRLFGMSIAISADLCAAGTAYGLAIGRIGCLFAGCCFGKPTASVAGIAYWNFALPVRPIGVPLHPSPLYEALALGLIAVYVHAMGPLQSRPNREGSRFLIFVAGYACARFFIEFTRADSRGALGALSTSQIISLLAAAAAFLLLRAMKRSSQTITV